MKLHDIPVALFFLITLCVAGNATQASPSVARPLQTVSIALPEPVATPPAWSQAELGCLARMIYGEARNQPYAGQVAVAAVAVNRSLKARWAGDLCSVVKAKGQFQGYRDRVRPRNQVDTLAWEQALRAAQHATDGYGTLPKSYQSSYFFHAKAAKGFDRWATPQGRIGDHVFYTIKGSA